MRRKEGEIVKAGWNYFQIFNIFEYETAFPKLGSRWVFFKEVEPGSAFS